MKTGAEIKDVLEGLESVDPAAGFLACPLSLAAEFRGNPEPETAARMLHWPEPVCNAIAARFDGTGWPNSQKERAAAYPERFKAAKAEGVKACHDGPARGKTKR